MCQMHVGGARLRCPSCPIGVDHTILARPWGWGRASEGLGSSTRIRSGPSLAAPGPAERPQPGGEDADLQHEAAHHIMLAAGPTRPADAHIGRPDAALAADAARWRSERASSCHAPAVFDLRPHELARVAVG